MSTIPLVVFDLVACMKHLFNITQMDSRVFIIALITLNKHLCLYFSLGSGDTYGIICGTYKTIAYFPVKEKYYVTECDENCDIAIKNCEKKMVKICDINPHQYNHLNRDFCSLENPSSYCQKRLTYDECSISCRRVTRQRTRIVPRSVTKVSKAAMQQAVCVKAVFTICDVQMKSFLLILFYTCMKLLG